MKRIRCPKCESYLTFDETKYTEGQSLVFVCDHCKKQFSIRLGKTKMQAPRKEEKLAIMQAICDSCGLQSEAQGIVLSLPVDRVVGLE